MKRLFACLLLCAGLAYGQDATQSPLDRLVGLWGGEQGSGSVVRGELTIDSRNKELRARIAGYDVPVEKTDNELRFRLPDDQGEFRGRIRQLLFVDGIWIQPQGRGRPMGYASPVRLTMSRQSAWRGTVTPLEVPARFYLNIERKSGGGLIAYIRNPEHNWFGRGMYEVTMAGDSVTLTRGKQQISGTYDKEGDSLFITALDGESPLKFTRRKPETALGFVPRVPQEPYVYRPPLAQNDGWQTGTLAEAGIDEKPVEELIQKILSSDPAKHALGFQGILIARHGKLVLEEYFYGYSSDRAHDMRSASKTIATLLAGVAKDHGAKIDPARPALSYFPQYKDIANLDERKRRIKLADLMNMASGLCDDSVEASSEDFMQEQSAQPDWFKFALDLPMQRDPGGNTAYYCSSNLNLVGGAVRGATGRWLPEYFDEYVARPLAFRTFYMNLLPTGEGYMGGGMYITPRDQLKLGQVYLSGGLWNGKRILSQAWVKESLQQRISFESYGDFDPPVHGYGYGWHTREHKAGDKTIRDYFMGGNGGQNVIVIPALDMVIVFTGGNYAEANKFFRWENELMPQYILPAVK